MLQLPITQTLSLDTVTMQLLLLLPVGWRPACNQAPHLQTGGRESATLLQSASLQQAVR